MDMTGMEMPGAALNLALVLSMSAFTITVMQGVLSLESSRPVRISYRKTLIMLALQVTLLPLIVAAEIVTYVHAMRELHVKLNWLSWAPAALVALGLLAYVHDTMYTLFKLVSARVYWIPMGSTRKRKFKIFDLVPLLITSILIGLLALWRQLWFLGERFVSVENAKTTRSLGHGPIAIGVIIATVGAALGTIITVAMLVMNSPGSMWKTLRHLRNARSLRMKCKQFNTSGIRERINVEGVDPKRLNRQLELLVGIQRGEDESKRFEGENAMLDASTILYSLPLQVRNLIVGEDKKFVLPSRAPFFVPGRWDVFEVMSLVVQISLFPLLATLLFAMLRLHSHFDKEMYASFKELVDVCVLYCSLQLFFGFKRWLWSLSGCSESEMDGTYERDEKMRYISTEGPHSSDDYTVASPVHREQGDLHTYQPYAQGAPVGASPKAYVSVQINKNGY